MEVGNIHKLIENPIEQEHQKGLWALLNRFHVGRGRNSVNEPTPKCDCWYKKHTDTRFVEESASK